MSVSLCVCLCVVIPSLCCFDVKPAGCHSKASESTCDECTCIVSINSIVCFTRVI